MIVTTTKVDKNIVRVEVDDQIVGFALRLTNGLWRPYGPDQNTPMGPGSFKSSKGATKPIVDAAAATPSTAN